MTGLNTSPAVEAAKWIEDNYANLLVTHNTRWVAAGLNGFITDAADPDELIRLIRLRKTPVADIAIAYITADLRA